MTRSAKTQREAAEKLKNMQRELEQGTLAKGPPQTVKPYLEYWLEEVRKSRIRPVTDKGYRATLDNYLLPILGHIQLRKLTSEHIQALYAQKKEDGLLPSLSSILMRCFIRHWPMQYAESAWLTMCAMMWSYREKQRMRYGQ